MHGYQYLGVDGLFCEQPDQAARIIDKMLLDQPTTAFFDTNSGSKKTIEVNVRRWQRSERIATRDLELN